MARAVKCCVTKESGNSDTFIKINGKYYKSKEIYEENENRKILRDNLIKFIIEDLLNYQDGQVCPPLIKKKINELSFYNDEVILRTFKEKKDDILYQINQSIKFDNDNGKIFYMFAIIRNSINDVYKIWLREQNEHKKQIVADDSVSIDDIPVSSVNKNNILNFLEDEDI